MAMWCSTRKPILFLSPVEISQTLRVNAKCDRAQNKMQQRRLFTQQCVLLFLLLFVVVVFFCCWSLSRLLSLSTIYYVAHICLGDIWIVASNTHIYLLYLHFNKSRVFVRVCAHIHSFCSPICCKRAEHRQAQQNVCHKSYDFGWKTFLNFIPLDIHLVVYFHFSCLHLHHLRLRLGWCVYFFLRFLVGLFYSFVVFFFFEKYSFEIRLSILQTITKEIEQKTTRKKTWKKQTKRRQREKRDSAENW